MTRPRWRTRGALVSALAVTLAPACGAATELDLNRCGDPNGICTDVANTASEVIYACHVQAQLLVLNQSRDGIIPVCLPPQLNRWIGTPAQVAALDAMSQRDYDIAVAAFGQNTLLGQLAALKAIDASGANCAIWLAALGDPNSYCNVVSATRDPFCEDPSNCAENICVPNDCQEPELPDGAINPHACNCNTSVASATDCDFPGATVCIAP
jgi:hypothetical protein